MNRVWIFSVLMTVFVQNVDLKSFEHLQNNIDTKQLPEILQGLKNLYQLRFDRSSDEYLEKLTFDNNLSMWRGGHNEAVDNSGDLNAVEKRSDGSDRTLRAAKRCFAQARERHGTRSERVFADFQACVKRVTSPRRRQRPKFHPKAW